MAEKAVVKKHKETNFEFLRVIAMLMVVVLHYLSHADALLQLGMPKSGVQVFATVIESLCIVAVNVWVLISGYFLSQSGFKLSRILQLICEVIFYTVLLSVVMMITGVYVVGSTDSVYKTVQYFFPIQSEHYWFATSYVLMYIFAPVLNAGVRNLSRLQLKATILGLLLWFCFIKSVIPVMFATDKYGYDFGWFICVYLIAAYIRKYNVTLFYSARKSAAVYLISCLIIFVMLLVLHEINLKRGGLIYYSTVPTHYNFIFTLTGALGLFSFFRFYKMRENTFAKVIRYIAPLTFGVYLVHEHIEIRDRWIVWLEHILGEVPKDSVFFFGWHMLRCVFIVFFAGLFVDWIRMIIFDYLGRTLHDTGLFTWLRKMDKELC